MTDILLKQILDKLNSAKRVLFCTLHTTIFFTYNDISQHLSSSVFCLLYMEFIETVTGISILTAHQLNMIPMPIIILRP